MGRMVMPAQPAQALVVHGLRAPARPVPADAAALRRARDQAGERLARGTVPRARTGIACGRGRSSRQGLVAHAGVVKPSDDVLGDDLCLVGFGVDPAETLERRGARALAARRRPLRPDHASRPAAQPGRARGPLRGSRGPLPRRFALARLGRGRATGPDGPVRGSGAGERTSSSTTTLALLEVPAATLRQETATVRKDMG